MSDQRQDPRNEAERRLRLMLAAEAKAEHATLDRIKIGCYGLLALAVAAFLALIFLS
ncbi:MAG TPA: hypothetical protein VFL90_07060 [Methylomirabilota bacterium]|nr:hypothetical protein [Methylomirabilota bacterium]